MIGPMKKKVITSVVLTAVVLIVVFSVFAFLYVSSTNKTIADLEAKKADAKAYVFARDLLAGNVVTEDDIKFIEIKNESAASDSYGFESDMYEIVGRRLKVNAKEKTIVTSSLLFEKDEETNVDTRLQEFNMILLPSDLDEGDYIDVRILFPTGEDYSVLVGKRVESFGALEEQSTTIFLRLSEEEIVRMGSAIIESYIRDGVKLYANKYVEPATQLFKTERVDLVAKYESVRYEGDSGDVLTTINASGETVPVETERIERTPEQIASILKVNVDDIYNIIDALENNDDSTLKYYRDIEVTYRRDDFKSNYPVKSEVATLILNNPNILPYLKEKYNIAELEAERQYFLDTEVETIDELTGKPVENEEHMSSIKENLDKEIETQKNERQEYLLNLLATQSTTN